MNTTIITLILVLIICVLWIDHKIEKEKKRNRILQAFLAGVIRVISDYKSTTDEIGDVMELPDRALHLPIPYKIVLDNIDWEFSRDMLSMNYEEWLKHDRDIFYDNSRTSDGFNFMYWDFFDRRLKEWLSADSGHHHQTDKA